MMISGMRTIAGGLFGLGVLVALGSDGHAQSQTAFLKLSGTWSGSGKIQLQDGKSEALKCRAFYTPKEAGATLGLAIRCASASNKIELRANLNQKSGAIEGMWEERTFNAAGSVTGKLTANRMTLSISGGAFQGTMSVSITGERHTVSIETKGINLKAVSIDLSRG